MGLWGFLKRLMGFKEEPKPAYVPFYVTHGESETNSAFWGQKRKELDEQMEWARLKRSRYG
jgi:hypothetical protein